MNAHGQLPSRRLRNIVGTALAVAATAFVGALPVESTPAQDPEPGALRIHITDETGTAVADQEVFVIISNGEGVVEELTGTTDDQGSAVFGDIAVGVQFSARAVTLYEQYPYQSEDTAMLPGLESVLPLGVFSVGVDPANLHINVLHMIINVLEPGVYQAIQLVEVWNAGTRASYSGEEFDGRQVGLIIPVPSAATGIAPVGDISVSGLDTNNLALDGNRLLDLRPVPPGTHQKVLQYDLFTGNAGADVNLSLPYPTAQITILAGPGLDAVEISSGQLSELPPAADIPGGPFAHWGSDVMSAGETLSFRLGPQRPTMTVSSWSLLGLATALLASAVASIWGGRPPGAPGDRARLIAEAASLDHAHDLGDVDDADYHDRRNAIIGHLMQLSGDGPPEQGVPDA